MKHTKTDIKNTATNNGRQSTTLAKTSPPKKGGVSACGGRGDSDKNTVGNYLKINNLPYLKTFRRELRNNLTPAEATLWKHLQRKQLGGRKFRRQHSIGNYIVDFYCPAERLAIELDGQGHYTATGQEKDAERTAFLNEFDVNVIRFENKWVFRDLEGVLEEIKRNFKSPKG